MSALTHEVLDLNFISDRSLQKTIESAIEYIVSLLTLTEEDGRNSLFIEETYRVIILYVASIIEAIFLHCFKEKGHSILYTEYKHVKKLPGAFHYLNDNGSVIIAVENSVPKLEHQLGLHELVRFFKERKSIKPETALKILEINDIRNTVHLSKTRTKACDIDRVEFAFKILVHIIKNSPKLLK